MNAHSALTEEQRALQELVDSMAQSLDRLAAHSRFAQAERAYRERNEAWRNSPEGIAYRDKCRSRDAENKAFWERIEAARPQRSPEEVAARIRAACASWMDVEGE